MRKKHLFILITLLLVLATALITTLKATTPKDKSTQTNTLPLLEQPPLDMSEVKEVLIFGEELSPGRKNPTFEYYTNNTDTKIYSVSQGKVIDIDLKEDSNDYVIVVESPDKSNWYIVYDHITDPQIQEGEKITAGIYLGKVGNWNQNTGRTELQINQKLENDFLAHCPFDLATDQFINEHKLFTEEWCNTDTIIP